MIDSVPTDSIPKFNVVSDCGKLTTSVNLGNISSDWIPSDTADYTLSLEKFYVAGVISVVALDRALPTIVSTRYECINDEGRVSCSDVCRGHRVRGANIDAIRFATVHDHVNSTYSRVDLFRYSDDLILREWNKTDLGMVARMAQFDIHARNQLNQQPNTTLWVRRRFHSDREHEVDLELVAVDRRIFSVSEKGVTICRVLFNPKTNVGVRFVDEYLKRVRYWQHFTWNRGVVYSSGDLKANGYPEVFRAKPFYNKKDRLDNYQGVALVDEDESNNQTPRPLWLRMFKFEPVTKDYDQDQKSENKWCLTVPQDRVVKDVASVPDVNASSSTDATRSEPDQTQQPQVVTPDVHVPNVGSTPKPKVFAYRDQFTDWVPRDGDVFIFPASPPSDFYITTTPYTRYEKKSARVVLSKVNSDRLIEQLHEQFLTRSPLQFTTEDIVGFSSVRHITAEDKINTLVEKVIVVRYGSDDELSSEYQDLYCNLFASALPHAWFKDRFNVGPFDWNPTTGRIANVGNNAYTEKPTLWLRIIVTSTSVSDHPQDIVSICHEYVSSETGNIVGSAHLDIKERTLYRYVRFDDERTRIWNRICISGDSNRMTFWPNADRTQFGKCVFDSTDMFRNMLENRNAVMYESSSVHSGNLFKTVNSPCFCPSCVDPCVLALLNKYHTVDVLASMIRNALPVSLPATVPTPDQQPDATVVTTPISPETAADAVVEEPKPVVLQLPDAENMVLETKETATWSLPTPPIFPMKVKSVEYEFSTEEPPSDKIPYSTTRTTKGVFTNKEKATYIFRSWSDGSFGDFVDGMKYSLSPINVTLVLPEDVNDVSIKVVTMTEPVMVFHPFGRDKTETHNTYITKPIGKVRFFYRVNAILAFLNALDFESDSPV